VKIDTIRIDMNFGSKPAEAALPAVRELFEKSGAVRFGLSAARFEEILEQVAAKYSPDANSQQKQQLWRELRIEELVLVNNSKHPLILLAGEVVTGGKQDRVVGKDRIVPAESDPVDLSVFCVEHGRWVESSAKFDTHAYVMAQPSVRKQAMVANNQQKVWDEVANSKASMSANSEANLRRADPSSAAPSPAPMVELRKLDETTSYAKTRENKVIQQQVDDIVGPMQKSYESVIKQLREQNAVGVVVAVKGHIIWADIFASTGLLSKYWPKLLQSYAAEALSMSGERTEITSKSAQQFLDNWQTTHEVVESEPGLYRQTEMTGDKFKAFELTSLLPKQNFDLHLSKIVK